MSRLIQFRQLDIGDDEDPSYVDPKAIEKASDLLKLVVNGVHDEDWDTDPNLKKTPERFARMIRELTTGEDYDFTTFPNAMKRNEMVVQTNIDFVSLCSHHVIPFYGKAHIAYIPDEVIVGLSKLARATRWHAAGLWTQEDLTDTISEYLEEMLQPIGVAVIMEAEHLCMSFRGIQAQGTKTITSSIRGAFLDPEPGRDPKTEFLRLIELTR